MCLYGDLRCSLECLPAKHLTIAVLSLSPTRMCVVFNLCSVQREHGIMVSSATCALSAQVTALLSVRLVYTDNKEKPHCVDASAPKHADWLAVH